MTTHFVVKRLHDGFYLTAEGTWSFYVRDAEYFATANDCDARVARLYPDPAKQPACFAQRVS